MIPTREDILKFKFEIRQDRVNPKQYFVLGDTGEDGPLATICFVSTNFPDLNKMLAEMIVDGLKKLQENKES